MAEANKYTQENLPNITQFKPAKSFDYSLIHFLSFSDSILISIDLRSVAEKDKSNSLFIYFLYCSFVIRMMHENGLPVRGAIDYGEYIMVDNFIAGLPIIESYKLGNRVEMEGVVFTEKASDVMLEICKDSGYGIQHTAAPYLTPLKNDVEQKLFVLSPSPCTTPIYGDIREYVLRAFWQHSKDISLLVRNKANNTEQYLRFVKTFHDHLFQEEPQDKVEKKVKDRTKKSKGNKKPRTRKNT